MSNPIFEVTDSNFDADVLKADTPVLVDFWAEWCGPCKMIAPVLEELAIEYDGKIKVGKCNVENHTQTPAKYGITSIPNVVLFKQGEIVGRIVGAESKSKFKDMIDKIV